MKQDNPYITFKDAYKPPFKVWMNDVPIYVQSSEGVTAFSVMNPERIDVIRRMVSLINEEEGVVPFEHCGANRERHVIADADLTPVLLLRGWGHLTGGGAMNLPFERAAKIQDDFFDFCLRKILGKPDDWSFPETKG